MGAGRGGMAQPLSALGASPTSLGGTFGAASGSASGAPQGIEFHRLGRPLREGESLELERSRERVKREASAALERCREFEAEIRFHERRAAWEVGPPETSAGQAAADEALRSLMQGLD